MNRTFNSVATALSLSLAVLFAGCTYPEREEAQRAAQRQEATERRVSYTQSRMSEVERELEDTQRRLAVAERSNQLAACENAEGPDQQKACDRLKTRARLEALDRSEQYSEFRQDCLDGEWEEGIYKCRELESMLGLYSQDIENMRERRERDRYGEFREKCLNPQEKAQNRSRCDELQAVLDLDDRGIERQREIAEYNQAKAACGFWPYPGDEDFCLLSLDAAGQCQGAPRGLVSIGYIEEEAAEKVKACELFRELSGPA